MKKTYLGVLSSVALGVAILVFSAGVTPKETVRIGQSTGVTTTRVLGSLSDADYENAAVDVVSSQTFVSQPSTPIGRGKGQQVVGRATRVDPLADGVWVAELDGPMQILYWDGFFLLRRAVDGSIVSVPGPPNVELLAAAGNGSEIVLATSQGLFAASLVGVRNGAPIWEHRDKSDLSAGMFSSVTRERLPLGGGAELVCFEQTCALRTSVTFDGQVADGYLATFDGGRRWESKADGVPAGGCYNDDLFVGGPWLICDTDVDEKDSDHAISLEWSSFEFPRALHWSVASQAFFGQMADLSFVRWKPLKEPELIVAADPMNVDFVELPNGDRLLLKRAGDSYVVTKNGSEVFRSALNSKELAEEYDPALSYFGGTEVFMLGHGSTTDGTHWVPQPPAPEDSLDIRSFGVFASGSATDAFSVAGAGSKISGLVHSNGAITIQGANHKLTGGAEYVSILAINGASNVISPVAKKTAVWTNPTGSLVNFRNNGAATRVSGYRAIPSSSCVNGIWTPTPNDLSGVIYVPCGVKLSGAGQTKKVSLAADGPIVLSGAGWNLSPAFGQSIFVSSADISLSGAGLVARGLVDAGGVLRQSGAANTIDCLAGKAVSLSGAQLTIAGGCSL
jgi:hypothetical protein